MTDHNVLISGPAGAGKSALAAELLESMPPPVVIADFTRLWVALHGIERDPVTGLYPTRFSADNPTLPLVEHLRRELIESAVERDIGVVATNSDSDPARRAALLRALGPGASERIVDPGRAVVEARLAAHSPDGELTEECVAAVRRWYK